MVPPAAVLVLLSASAWGRAIENPIVKCEPPEKPQCSVPAAPGTAEPQCGYDGDHKKDIKAVFDRIKPFTGLKSVGLREIHGEAAAGTQACELDVSGGAVASNDGRQITVCDTIFAWVRNEDQLAALLGHEFAHIHFGHWDSYGRAFDAMFKAWKSSRSSSYFRMTPEDAQLEDLKEALCPRLLKLMRAQEAQADRQGLKWAHDAGFDASKAAGMHWQDRDLYWVAHEPEKADGTHPSSTERARALEEEAARLKR